MAPAEKKRPLPVPVPVAEDDADPRARLIEGMGQSLAERPYGDITIADIVKRARVSKRTFYQHFVDKQELFLATYTDVSLGILRDMSLAADAVSVGEAQIVASASAYFSSLERRRALVLGLMHGVHAAGLPALMLHHKFLLRFSAQLTVMVERARKVHTEVAPLSGALALAIVGGINELMVVHVETQPNVALTQLVPTAVEFARAVIFGPRNQPLGLRRPPG